MGIEYTLANKSNKTLFDLGKGGWGELCCYRDGGDENLLYEESIYQIIKHEVFFGWGDKDDAYIQKLAKAIYHFVRDTDPTNIILTSDCDDSTGDLEREGYRYVGCRYYLDNEEQNAKEIAILNKYAQMWYEWEQQRCRK
jgi:hypothetical protein